MADEVTQVQRAQKSKLTLGDLGAPGLVNTLPADQLVNGKYFVGTILGRASGFVERANIKTEEIMEGLKGTFVMVPSEPRMGEMESGVLFVPDAFHNLLSTPLRKAQDTDNKAALEFALEVYSIKAKNPAGYSWEMYPAVPFTGKHPLDDLMKKVAALPADRAKRLAAPAKK
jgi:hypothetical protein